MGQYAAMIIIFITFSHISTIGWIIFKFPKDIAYYALKPDETPHWFWSKHEYYFHHLYFVVTTCSTNGYGDITPDKNSTSELIFGMAVELVGLSILGIMWLLNNLLLDNFRVQSVKVHKNMKDFKEWFKTLENTSRVSIPRPVTHELFKFFNAIYRLEMDTIVYDNQYLDELCGNIARDLEEAYHQAHPSPFVDLLSKYDMKMCAEIIKQSEPASYLPDTVILNRGHMSPGMYWISQGTVCLTYLRKDQIIEELHEADSFGGFCLLEEPARCNYVTKNLCMMHFLAKSKLEDILETFRVDALQFIKEVSDEFQYLLEKRNAYKTLLRFGRQRKLRGNGQDPKSLAQYSKNFKYG